LRQFEDKTSFLFSTFASNDTCGIHLFHSLTADELWAPPTSKIFHGTVSKPKQLFLVCTLLWLLCRLLDLLGSQSRLHLE
jgi:hypothetical protein